MVFENEKHDLGKLLCHSFCVLCGWQKRWTISNPEISISCVPCLISRRKYSCHKHSQTILASEEAECLQAFHQLLCSATFDSSVNVKESHGKQSMFVRNVSNHFVTTRGKCDHCWNMQKESQVKCMCLPLKKNICSFFVSSGGSSGFENIYRVLRVTSSSVAVWVVHHWFVVVTCLVKSDLPNWKRPVVLYVCWCALADNKFSHIHSFQVVPKQVTDP